MDYTEETESRAVAIIGAGFAGLAACWTLCQRARYSITVYDGQGIGGGASGISAGLVHPFTGPEARVPPHGLEAFSCASELIKHVAQDDPRVLLSQGIARVALTETQRIAFQERSKQHTGCLKWLTESESQVLVPGLVSAPVLWIADGLAIDSQKYLQGLWTLSERRGAIFRKESIRNLAQLATYDQIVVACGFASRRFPELAPLSIRGLKGQIIELAWPKGLPPLAAPLLGDVYLIPAREGRSCLVGATFEREFATEQCDVTLAEMQLRPKAEALIPALRGAQLLDCRAGIRATTPDRQPVARTIDGRIWALTAFGAKGLLYHVHLSKALLHQNM